MENLINFLLNLFSDNVILFSPIAGFLSEDILLFIVILASVQEISMSVFLIVALFGLIGIIIHDSLLYYFTNLKFFNRFSAKFSSSNNSLIKLIRGFDKSKYLVPLTFSKFIYGLRTAAVILFSRNRKFKHFLLYNSIATLIWLIVMLPIGWLAGQGFSFLLKTAANIEKILAMIFILIVIIWAVGRMFKHEAKVQISNSN
ncbi:MAG: hypothetical protein AABW89_04725 [Nanoarchaeota archaeon]